MAKGRHGLRGGVGGYRVGTRGGLWRDSTRDHTRTVHTVVWSFPYIPPVRLKKKFSPLFVPLSLMSFYYKSKKISEQTPVLDTPFPCPKLSFFPWKKSWKGLLAMRAVMVIR
jgi:hypothetical protein